MGRDDPVSVLRDVVVPFLIWLRDITDMFSVWSRDVKSGISYLIGRAHMSVSSNASYSFPMTCGTHLPFFLFFIFLSLPYPFVLYSRHPNRMQRPPPPEPREREASLFLRRRSGMRGAPIVFLPSSSVRRGWG